ncbi:hypothetical protein [Synechococcus sp. CS-1328]|uniref:hypothetical protein n=1 Tax=Synechococcus sp. CS-1328 TaxID=2847976 RepID=UPI00223B6382|nr:hypothetical protein [Synechococcus sp. CS-1328]MCT0224764.1 hypothetical protein [Synechococcus sp. CS-1328]
MDEAAIPRLEALSRDYSETPRRILFVLGSGDRAGAEVFRRLAPLPHTSIDPQHLEELAAGTRRSLPLSTPMQMVPEIVRSLSQANVAIYQVLLLSNEQHDP